MLIHLVIVVIFFQITVGDCVDLDLGMESGLIPDDRIFASSELPVYRAIYGRLNHPKGPWCPAEFGDLPYLQIDLQTLHVICAVSVQASLDNFTLQSSRDGKTWTNYTENGRIKVGCRRQRCASTVNLNW